MSVKKAIISAFLLYLVIIISFSFLYSDSAETSGIPDGESAPVSSRENPVAKPVNKTVYLYTGERADLSKYADSADLVFDGGNSLFTAGSEGVYSVFAKSSDGKQSVSFTVNVFGRQETERKKYKVNVYKNNQTVVVFDKDKNGNYTVPVKVMQCATGDETSETKTGNYKVINHYRWRLLKGPSYGQYATSFSGEYLFHSMPYDRQEENTLWDNSYEQLGAKSSHGCIRMTLIDTKWIYDHVEKSSPVSVLAESAEYPAPPSPSVIEGERYAGWDPTDISDRNPYKIDGLTPAPAVHIGETEKTLKAGETHKINICGSSESYIYFSTDTDVAVVGKNGQITAKSKGECTIYIIGNDGADVSMKLTVK